MADPQPHIQQWLHNRQFLSEIKPAYPDWIVTVAFYVALHAVDALFASDNVTVTSHDARNDVLMRTNRYQKICRHYRPLYNLSRTVRYLADPEKWVLPEKIDAEVLRRNLYPLEQSVIGLMQKSLPLPPIVLIH